MVEVGKTEYIVEYNTGFGDMPHHVFADNYEDAKRVGLAEYRKHTGFVDTVDTFSIDEVVKVIKPAI